MYWYILRNYTCEHFSSMSTAMATMPVSPALMTTPDSHCHGHKYDPIPRQTKHPPSSTSVPIATAHELCTLWQCRIHPGMWHQLPSLHKRHHEMNKQPPGYPHWAGWWQWQWSQGGFYCEVGLWHGLVDGQYWRRANKNEVGGWERTNGMAASRSGCRLWTTMTTTTPF